MAIVHWEQGNRSENGYLRRSEDGVLLSRLRRLFARKKRRSEHCTTETCLEKADQKLHEQATRLHVLEWEAYGHPKHRRRESH